MASCKAAANVAGEHFYCELDYPHDKLAHSNQAGQLIWRGGEQDLTAYNPAMNVQKEWDNAAE